MNYNVNLPLQVWQTMLDALEDKISQLEGRPGAERELYEATKARVRFLDELRKQGVFFEE